MRERGGVLPQPVTHAKRRALQHAAAPSVFFSRSHQLLLTGANRPRGVSHSCNCVATQLGGDTPLFPCGPSLCPVPHRRPRSTWPAAHGTCFPPAHGTRFSLFMARGVRKPVLASLRTRFIVFTLLFAMSEVDAMPPSLFDVPSVPQVDTIRVLWIVSYHMLPVMSTRRYLTATRCIRNKCGDWYTNVLFRSTV